MNKIKKLLLALLSLFVAFVAGWFVIFRIIQNPSSIPNSFLEQATEETRKEIEIKLIFDQENKLSSSSVPWKDQITAYDILTKFANENNIKIETEQYDFGVLVKSINGFENSSEHTWIYFVNGESGQVSADNQTVEPGDQIEWKYIKPEF